MADVDALPRILRQVDAAREEMDAYDPPGMGWHARAVLTATTLVPWLVQEAPGLRVYVEEVLNSPKLLRAAWEGLKSRIDAVGEVARIDELLGRERVLLNFVAGDTVSVVVTGHLLNRYPGGELSGNSKSDYPDLFLKTADYGGLPTRSRAEERIGAAVRGKDRCPVRVPDGLEIKTSRNGATIDCHYAHVGLHLILSFDTRGQHVVVDDVLAAFLRDADYKKTVPRTKTTTLKASFSRASFVSLLPDSDMAG